MGFYKNFLVFAILLIIFNLQCCFGQNIKFKHLTVDDGLSQSWIQCIFQDKLGYMWFGSEEGLNRFDGYEIVQYKNNSHDKNTISNNAIRCINEDLDGNLWIGTQKGLNVYDRGKNIFYQNPNWPRETISSIKKDNLNNLWVSTYNKLLKYNSSTHNFIVFEPLRAIYPKLLQNGNLFITTVFCDEKNNIWIGTNLGLCLYNPKSNSSTCYFQLDENPENFGNYNITSIFEDHLSRIWIGHTKGLILYKNDHLKPIKGDFIHFNHEANNPQSIAMGDILAINEDKEHNLWIGALNGGINILDLNEFDRDKANFKHYKNIPSVSNSLSNNSIYSIFVDKQQNIWIGTFGKGVNRYSPYYDNFQVFRNNPLIWNSLNNDQVFSFLEDGNFIWIGTGGAGLDRFDKRNNSFTFYPNDPTNNSNKEIGGIWAMLKDHTGDIWLGTWAEGFKRFNPKTKSFIRYTNNPLDSTSISSNNVFAICEDKDGNIWLGTVGGGLNMYNRQTNKFIRYNSQNTKGLANYIESIVTDKNGALWIENNGSLARFDRKTKNIKNYKQDTNDSKSLSGSKVYAIFYDSKANLWVGTDVGLNLYQPETDNFKSYQVQEGLSDNAIKSIAEDKFGNLWLGTNKGLSKFIGAINLPKTPKFKNYRQEDGLQSNEFNKRACLTGTDGSLYFGGENGFNVFNPGEIRENSNIPNIVFSDFMLFNKPVDIGMDGSPLMQHICQTKTIKLNYYQSVFTIKYAALNYVVSSKNQYAYIMEGYEPNWNYVGNKREATYTGLPQGTYTFRVKASNNDGVWNEKGTSIKITILPPWWKTMWFRMLVFTFLILLITSFFYWRVASYKKQQRELKILVRQRTEELEDANIQLLHEKVLTEEQKATLIEANLYLSEQQTRIEEYVEEVNSQNEKLKYANEQLLEHQARIEEQAEELRARSENLKEANDLLLEKQNLIQLQSTKLEETNQELALLNSTKDRFFSILAHDLRNPFHAVSGLTEILLKDFTKIPPEKTERFLKLINASSESGRNLLENLLQWSRSQTNRMKFETVAINLKSIASENLELIEGQIHQKSITIKSKILPDINVFADVDMVKTVFRNLLSNAIKFTHKNGIISINVSTKEKFAEIAIADTGVGIPEKKLGLLFRIDANTSTKGTENETGTGLGLVLCKEFVEKNGGQIWVESEVGKGSEFKFTLPLV